MKIIRRTSLGILLMLVFSHIQAQRGYDTTTINLMAEIDLIQQKYSAHSEIEATYYLTEADSISTVYDTVTVSMLMDKNQYKLLFDSTLSIQNERYNATIYPDNKVVVIQAAVPSNTTVMAFDIHDPVFQSAGLKQITGKDSTTFRILTFSFDPTSFYKSYEIVYEKDTYDLNEIRFKVLKNPTNASEGFVQMRMKYLSFKVGTYDNSVFSTDSYFTVKSASEILIGSALSSDYEIVNMINN